MNSTYYAAPSIIRFSVTGLRPSTTHLFFFDGVDQTAQVWPDGGKFGDALISDSSGKISFGYVFESGVTANSTLSAQQSALNLIAGNKTAIIRTADASSYAACVLALLTKDSSTTDVTTSGLYEFRVVSGA